MEPIAYETSISSSESSNSGAPVAEPLLKTRPPQKGGYGVLNLPSLALERSLLRTLLKGAGNPPLTITLWDDEQVRLDARKSLASMRVGDRWRLWNLLLDPSFEFCEAYTRGDVEFSGELFDLLNHVIPGIAEPRFHQWFTVGSLSNWWHWPHRNTFGGSKLNIQHHYDIGNDFYKLWLDDQLVYTCAYFADPKWTLEQAQTAKLDHVCRKLGLSSGQSVVEAGCGWGALALHMAKHYGAKVRAYNISREQIDYARQRARQEGIEHRVEFIEDDWRNIRGEYDAFVSVGMLEHAGLKNYRRLGEVINACLKPHGRGLIHSIGQNRAEPLNAWIERRIFPGAYPPSLAEMMRIFEPRYFSVLDVENLRMHYAVTLRHWLSRFEKSVDRVRSMFDERFVRTWRLYLACSTVAFETGGLQLFQITFARGNNNDIPWNRADLYLNADHPQPTRETAYAHNGHGTGNGQGAGNGHSAGEA